MENQQQERIRRATPDELNKEVDEKTLENIRHYAHLSPTERDQRLEELVKEWDMERTLMVNASALSLTGLALGALVDKRWFILPGVVVAFLLQHGLQGWCPPLPLFRALKFRSRTEINEERFALKALRGDFNNATNKTPEDLLSAVKR